MNNAEGGRKLQKIKWCTKLGIRTLSSKLLVERSSSGDQRSWKPEAQSSQTLQSIVSATEICIAMPFIIWVFSCLNVSMGLHWNPPSMNVPYNEGSDRVLLSSLTFIVSWSRSPEQLSLQQQAFSPDVVAPQVTKSCKAINLLWINYEFILQCSNSGGVTIRPNLPTVFTGFQDHRFSYG